MSTIIEINGLHVEFTDQKPTRPGAVYALTPAFPAEPKLEECFEVHGNLCVAFASRPRPVQSLVGWLWSAPLVPVTEVEKAYREGWDNADCMGAEGRWEESNARKVVEGLP